MAEASSVLDELVVAGCAELGTWLTDHQASSPGVWLALTKKGGTVATLSWQQAVDEGLCFGWIDGQGRKRDEATSLIRFTPASIEVIMRAASETQRSAPRDVVLTACLGRRSRGTVTMRRCPLLLSPIRSGPFSMRGRS